MLRSCVLMLLCSGGIALADSITLTITDVGPSWNTVTRADAGGLSPAGKVVAVATSADGRDVYLGTPHGGLFHSRDFGVTFTQSTRPQPGDHSVVCPDSSGACPLPGRTLVDVAVSQADPNLVFVVAAFASNHERNGIWRSGDAGATWKLVHEMTCDGGASRVVFAPDDPTRLWAVGCDLAYSTNGGFNWTVPTGSPAGVNQIAVGPSLGTARVVWACNETTLWYSQNGGQSFSSMSTAGTRLQGGCASSHNHMSVGGEPGTKGISIDPTNPRRLFVVTRFPFIGTNPPVYFNSDTNYPDGQGCVRPDCRTYIDSSGNQRNSGSCGCHTTNLVAATLTTASPLAVATDQVPLPPHLITSGATAFSGAGAVLAQPKGADRFLLLYMDSNLVYVADVARGRLPGPRGWHRLDGADITELCPTPTAPSCNGGYANPVSRGGGAPVHPDPADFAVSGSFTLDLGQPVGSPPYDRGSPLVTASCHGWMYLANDGGIYRSPDCGQSWGPPRVLRTLGGNEINGVIRPGQAPWLYFGTQDNGAWFSRDGGAHWVPSNAGDAGGFFADPLRNDFIGHFGGAQLYIYNGQNGVVPTGDAAGTVGIAPGSNGEHFYNIQRGYRPLILSAPNVSSPTLGSWVAAGPQRIYRTGVFLTWAPVGPAVGAAGDDLFVQTAGGTRNTTYFVGSGGSRWQILRSSPMGGPPTGWDCIRPGPANPGVHDGACVSGSSLPPWRLFIADPYDANVLYVEDGNGLSISTDAGNTFQPDLALGRALSGELDLLAAPPPTPTFPSPDALGLQARDTIRYLEWMTFVPNEPRTRFAVGQAGVFVTFNGRMPRDRPGAEVWHRLLDGRALPCTPSATWFDPDDVNHARNLYVTCNGRNVVRIGPIPTSQQGLSPQMSSFRVIGP